MTSPRWGFSNSRPVSRVGVPSVSSHLQSSNSNHRHSTGDDPSLIVRSQTSPINKPGAGFNRFVVHRQSTRARCQPVPSKAVPSAGHMVRSLPSSPPITPAFQQNNHTVTEPNKIIRKASSHHNNSYKLATSTVSLPTAHHITVITKTQFTTVMAPNNVQREERPHPESTSNENPVHINVVPGFHYPICASSACDGPEDLAAIGQRVFRPILQRKHSSSTTLASNSGFHATLPLPFKAYHASQSRDPPAPINSKVQEFHESIPKSVPTEEMDLPQEDNCMMRDCTENITKSFIERFTFKAESDFPPPEPFTNNAKRKYPSHRRRKRSHRKSHQSQNSSSTIPDKPPSQMHTVPPTTNI